MRFVLEIDMDNAAFDRSPFNEVQRCFDKAMRAVAHATIHPTLGADGAILDTNGNTVGRWEVTR